MPEVDHADMFIGKLKAALNKTTSELLQAGAPVSVHKQRYHELLTAARATGELDDYRGTLYVDPDTGLLAARFALCVPR